MAVVAVNRVYGGKRLAWCAFEFMGGGVSEGGHGWWWQTVMRNTKE